MGKVDKNAAQKFGGESLSVFKLFEKLEITYSYKLIIQIYFLHKTIISDVILPLAELLMSLFDLASIFLKSLKN